MCETCDNERERLLVLAIKSPSPCIVCEDKNVVAAATWIPDDTTRLAAGGTKTHRPVFAFCLCTDHTSDTPENEKLITQAVLRAVRSGRRTKP